MLYSAGRFLQLLGLLIPPAGIVGNIVQRDVRQRRRHADDPLRGRSRVSCRLVAAAGRPTPLKPARKSVIITPCHEKEELTTTTQRPQNRREEDVSSSLCSLRLCGSVFRRLCRLRMPCGSPAKTAAPSSDSRRPAPMKWAAAGPPQSMRICRCSTKPVPISSPRIPKAFAGFRLAGSSIAESRRRRNCWPPFANRMDAPARKLLETGLAARDAKALERLVATMFCARPTERALDVLGDMACEKGDWATARRYWSYLTPGDRPDAMIFPQPAGDPALPRAKIIVSRLLAGENAGEDIIAFQQLYQNTTGRLAGRDGKLADTLDDLAKSDRLRACRPTPMTATTTVCGFPISARRNRSRRFLCPTLRRMSRCD